MIVSRTMRDNLRPKPTPLSDVPGRPLTAHSPLPSPALDFPAVRAYIRAHLTRRCSVWPGQSPVFAVPV